jgi:hypothetical protein
MDTTTLLKAILLVPVLIAAAWAVLILSYILAPLMIVAVVFGVALVITKVREDSIR